MDHKELQTKNELKYVGICFAKKQRGDIYIFFF